MIQSPDFWLTLLFSCIVYWVLPTRLRLPFLAAISFLYISTIDFFSAVTLLLGSVSIKLVLEKTDFKSPASGVLIFVVVALIIWLVVLKSLGNLFIGLFEDTMFTRLFIPIGISYYIFKLIHFAVEFKRGGFQDLKTSEYLCWLFLFPIFSAGPIEQLDHFKKNYSLKYENSHIVEGCWRVAYGLIKQLVLVEIIILEKLMNGLSIAEVVTQIDTLRVYQMWGYLFLLYLYFYLEFSAYSDIAIGCSRLFGIKIVENFNWPIFATDISMFWKRWHMSLAGWCQRYVYLPTIARTRNPILAVYATFMTMGLWHAININYMMWGLYHATGVSIVLLWTKYKRQHRIPMQFKGVFKYWGLPVTFCFVGVGWTFSSTSGLGAGAAVAILKKLVGI